MNKKSQTETIEFECFHCGRANHFTAEVQQGGKSTSIVRSCTACGKPNEVTLEGGKSFWWDKWISRAAGNPDEKG